MQGTSGRGRVVPLTCGRSQRAASSQGRSTVSLLQRERCKCCRRQRQARRRRRRRSWRQRWQQLGTEHSSYPPAAAPLGQAAGLLRQHGHAASRLAGGRRHHGVRWDRAGQPAWASSRRRMAALMAVGAGPGPAVVHREGLQWVGGAGRGRRVQGGWPQALPGGCLGAAKKAIKYRGDNRELSEGSTRR